MSAQSGFYQVLSTMRQFGRRLGARGAGRVALPVGLGATLDLLPVDAVVTEILDLIAFGPATWNRTYHVTSDTPLPLAQVLSELSPMSGVAIKVSETDALETGTQAELMARRLRYYMPYFSIARCFDRHNAPPRRDMKRFRLDIEQLRGFAQSYFIQNAALPQAR